MNKVFVGTLDEILPRIGREVMVDNRKIAVFRLTDGRILAVDNVCPHKQGPLAEGTVSGEYVFCPLHDYKISLVNGEVQEPDEGCVQTFETVIEDQNVYVMVD